MFYPKQIHSSILRLWAIIAGIEALIIALVFISIGKSAFFLLGPFLLYDLFLYTYPYWYVPMLTTTLYKGAEFQKSQNMLKQTLKKHKHLRAELLMLNTEFNNILIFAHRRRLWVLTDKNFMDSFSEKEQQLIFQEISTLYGSERIATATVYSSLFMSLPFFPVKKGTELNFYSSNSDENWFYLNYKTFHRMSFKKNKTLSHLLPCLFFPALPNYSAESYFSLYTFLRERLIKSMKPAVAEPIEPQLQGEL